MYALLNVAFALLAGLLMTRIFSRWRLPDVTAFLVAGVLIGPFCLGRLGITGVGFAAYEDVAALGAISDVAMGFIAFAIGNEFRLEDLRKTGRQAFIIGVLPVSYTISEPTRLLSISYAVFCLKKKKTNKKKKKHAY